MRTDTIYRIVRKKINVKNFDWSKLSNTYISELVNGNKVEVRTQFEDPELGEVLDAFNENFLAEYTTGIHPLDDGSTLLITYEIQAINLDSDSEEKLYETRIDSWLWDEQKKVRLFEEQGKSYESFKSTLKELGIKMYEEPTETTKITGILYMNNLHLVRIELNEDGLIKELSIDREYE